MYIRHVIRNYLISTMHPYNREVNSADQELTVKLSLFDLSITLKADLCPYGYHMLRSSFHIRLRCYEEQPATLTKAEIHNKTPRWAQPQKRESAQPMRQ